MLLYARVGFNKKWKNGKKEKNQLRGKKLTGTEIGHGSLFPERESAESDEQEADETLGHAQGLRQFGREEATADAGSGARDAAHISVRLLATGQTLLAPLLQPIGERLTAVALARFTGDAVTAPGVQMRRRRSITNSRRPPVFRTFRRHFPCVLWTGKTTISLCKFPGDSFLLAPFRVCG